MTADARKTITLKWNTWVIGEEEEDPEGEGADGGVPGEGVDGPKWYESKTMQVTVSLALSFSTIALLLLLP